MSSVPALPPEQQLPAYLADQSKRIDDKKDIQKLLSPPRLKIVQSTSGQLFKGEGKFRDGDILIIPQMIKIGDLQTEFSFVPLHFFPTYCCFNPWDLKDRIPYIREQSFDEDSTVGKKALAFIDEPCPEDKKYNIEYRRVINVFMRIEGIDDPNVPDFITGIFNKAEYITGQKIIDLVTKRPADRYVQRYNAISKWKQDKKGSHHGLDVRNSPDMWVPEANVEAYRAMYVKLKEIVDSRQLKIDMDDQDMNQNGGNPADETKY